MPPAHGPHRPKSSIIAVVCCWLGLVLYAGAMKQWNGGSWNGSVLVLITLIAAIPLTAVRTLGCCQSRNLNGILIFVVSLITFGVSVGTIAIYAKSLFAEQTAQEKIDGKIEGMDEVTFKANSGIVTAGGVFFLLNLLIALLNIRQKPPHHTPGGGISLSPMSSEGGIISVITKTVNDHF